MSANRRECIRRMAVASGLLVAGLLSARELVQKSAQVGGNGGRNPPTLPTAPATTDQTVTATQTVTVTEYASGSVSQQSTTTSQSTQASSSTTQAVPNGYVLVTPLSALSGRTSAYFNHPSRGLSLLVSASGQWKAFSATCTHAPCTVQYSGASISCPCHGGTYNPNNGAVTGGPPPAPLPELAVLVQNGNLYVSA
jgi:Rieske Fe-S protein